MQLIRMIKIATKVAGIASSIYTGTNWKEINKLPGISNLIKKYKKPIIKDNSELILNAQKKIKNLEKE